MRHWLVHELIHTRYLLAALIVFAPLLGPVLYKVEAIPQVQERYDQISDSEVSAVATHRFGFRYTDLTSPVGSVTFEFCSNSPIIGDPCTAPNGLDLSSVSLSSQSGTTGFTLNGAVSTANMLVISRTPAVPAGAAASSTYVFTNVQNPSTVGSYYVRIQTYSTSNASGFAVEDGGVVFALTEPISINTEVPPYLLFCAAVTITGTDCDSATSFFIDFGEFSKTSAKAASSEMVGATNAPYGYGIFLAGTTLTSGNNLIPPLLTQTTSAPGTSQFGLNLTANSNPAIGAGPSGPGTAPVTSQYATPNQFRFVAGDAVVSTPTTSDVRKFTVSYLTNVATTQPGGVYATTVSYIALANF